MRWSQDKLDILLDEYEYCDLEKLSQKLGCTVKALTRKAEKLRLFRAKNNEVKDGIKYCTFCNTYHPAESNFYKNRTKNSNLEYACKLYFEKFKLNNIKEEPLLTTHLLNQKRGNQANRGNFEGKEREIVKHRPKNPIVIKDGIKGKVCNRCKVWKTLNDYGIDQKGIGQRRARCRLCYKEINSLK